MLHNKQNSQLTYLFQPLTQDSFLLKPSAPVSLNTEQHCSLPRDSLTELSFPRLTPSLTCKPLSFLTRTPPICSYLRKDTLAPTEDSSSSLKFCKGDYKWPPCSGTIAPTHCWCCPLKNVTESDSFNSKPRPLSAYNDRPNSFVSTSYSNSRNLFLSTVFVPNFPPPWW